MTIRPAVEEDIPRMAQVHVETWRTAYHGILADSFLDGLSCPKHEERHKRYLAKPGTVYFVAELPDDGIVGFISGGPQRGQDVQYPGELYAINILQQYRRQGTGSALVRQWAASLRHAGLNSASVWVLAENKPAVAFYRRLGARPLREQMIEIGGTSLCEIAYWWGDLNDLCQHRS